MADTPVLIVGPLAYDDVRTPGDHRRAVLGGSAAYASVAAAKYTRTMLISVCGDDLADGEVASLGAAGVELAGLERRRGPTLRWSGSYSEGFSRSTVENTDLGVVAGWRPAVPPAGRDAAYVFLTNTEPAIQSFALDQLRPSVTLLDTMDAWIGGDAGALDAMIQRVTLLAVNERELQLLSGCDDPDDAARAVLERGPAGVIVKRGPGGATLVTADGAFAVPAYPATVVDPTGAGDALGGAFIGRIASSGLQGGPALRDALVHGVAVASVTVGSFGIVALADADRRELDRRAAELAGVTRTG